MLTPADNAFLEGLGQTITVTEEDGWTLLVVHRWVLPLGYAPASSDLMLRIAPGYPDMPLDMWYFGPDVTRADGQPIPNTEAHETFGGQVWQRWSRHLAPGEWTPGVDGLEGYFARIRADLRLWVAGAAA